MPDPDLAIIELVALIIALPVSYVTGRVFKYVNLHRKEEELKQMFSWFWNGTPEDELYAWYKVRSVLTLREGEQRKIDMVNRKISEFNKQQMFSSTSIDSSGELVDEESKQHVNH